MQAKGTNGTVAFDGSFVTITRKGLTARLTVGKGEKRIPVSSISSVQFKPSGSFVAGFIEFSLAGGNEQRSGFGQQTWDAAQNENAVTFAKVQQSEFEPVRAEIEQAIANRQYGYQAHAQPTYQSQPTHQPQPQQAPAGWYGDPGGQPMLRWWTGAQRTGHTHSVHP